MNKGGKGNDKDRDLKPWRVLETRQLLDRSPWLSVFAETVETPEGRVVDSYYRVEQSDYAVIHAQTPDGLTLILRQYKHGARRVSPTFPAGGINKGEDPLEAARRELREETGYEAAEWRSLGSYVVQGNQHGCTCHMFQALGAVKVAEPDSGDLEEMRLELFTRDDLKAAFEAGEFILLPMVAMYGLIR